MSPRERVKSYGPSVAAMVAGVACSALVGGTSGEVIGIVLVSLGGVAAVSLLFYEVGLSEDRQRRHRPPGRGASEDRGRGTDEDAEGAQGAEGARGGGGRGLGGRGLTVSPLEQHRGEGRPPSPGGARAGPRRAVRRPRPPRRPG